MTQDKYPVLAPGYVLRRLESPFVYDISGDELYELDEEAFNFLKECNGKNPGSYSFDDGEMAEAIEFMLDEGILLMKDRPDPRNITIYHSPIPSLRYLLLDITNICNLACKHCYLGKSGNLEMNFGIFEKAVSQFEKMGGLKLMISGGEPLLHSKFQDLMDILPSYELRVVVLSNGRLSMKQRPGNYPFMPMKCRSVSMGSVLMTSFAAMAHIRDRWKVFPAC